MQPTRARRLVAGLRMLTLCGVFALSTFPLSSYDVWLHLGIGQEIVQRDEIPRTAWGSRRFSEKEWVDHEWAAQAALYHLHSRWGDQGLIILRAAAALLAAAFLLWALQEAGAGPFAGCAAAGLASFVWFTQLFWPARPQIATQLFLPLLLALLFRGRAGKRRLLFAVPILFVVWVNLHGGYIIGLGVITLFLMGDLLQGVFGRTGDPGWRKALAGLLICSTVACLANPYTYRSLLYPFTYYFGEPITVGNVEWEPLVLAEFALFEALVLVAAISLLVARPGPDPLELILALTFFHLSVISVRHVPLAATVLAVGLGASWSRWWRSEPLSFSAPIAKIAGAVRAGSFLPAALTLLVLALGFGSLWLSKTPPWWSDAGAWSRGRPLPVSAVKYMKENDLTEGLFNQYEWGGYLLYQFPGEAIVSIDGRNDIYGASVNARYLEVMEGIPTWKKTFDDWGVKTVLVSRGPRGWRLCTTLDRDPDWEPAYQGEHALIFVRRKDP